MESCRNSLCCLCLVTTLFVGVGNVGATSYRGTVYVVLIGINKYKVHSDARKNWKHLKYTGRDVKGISRILTGPGKVPKRNIKVLTNRKASKRRIIRTLKTWLKRAGPKDTVLVYFSGHGAAGSDGISYWMAYDTPKNAVESGVGHYTLNGILATLQTSRVVLVVDACQSGQGIKGARGGDGRKGVIDPSIYQSMGRAVIASSKQNQYSYESSQLKHGIFSYVLMQALSGKGDLDKDGVVTVMEAYQYLLSKVPALAKRLEGGSQNPVIKLNSSGLIALSFPQRNVVDVGWLKINVKPKGAKVRVNNVLEGHIGDKLKFPPGVLSISISMDGYKSHNERVRIRKNRVSRLFVTLKKVSGGSNAGDGSPFNPILYPNSSDSSFFAPARRRPGLTWSRRSRRPRRQPKERTKPSSLRVELGVYVRDVSKSVQKKLRLSSSRGAYVEKVISGSLAAKNGLRVGDVIIELNRRTIEHSLDLVSSLKKHPIGESISFLVRREGSALFVSFLWEVPKKSVPEPTLRRRVTILRRRVNRRPKKTDPKRKLRLGVTISDVPKKVQKQMNLPQGQGVHIEKVNKGSVAAKNGLRVGDVIVELNRETIKSPSDFVKRLAKIGKGENVLWLVRRNDSALFLAFPLP